MTGGTTQRHEEILQKDSSLSQHTLTKATRPICSRTKLQTKTREQPHALMRIQVNLCYMSTRFLGIVAENKCGVNWSCHYWLTLIFRQCYCQKRKVKLTNI